MYVNGLRNFRLSASVDSLCEYDAVKLSKKEMLKKLGETDKEIIKIIQNREIQEIDFFGEKIDKFFCISWLLQHEQLHFGKLMLYCANLKIHQS